MPGGADPRLLAAVKKANNDFEIAMTKSDTAMIAEPYTADAVFVIPQVMTDPMTIWLTP